MANVIFVFGPAGTGKTTFVNKFAEYSELYGKRIFRVNLDPANPTEYELDITNCINVVDVMERLDYGPNGGLMKALEIFSEEIYEIEELSSLFEDRDSYIFVDCPGQIELYLHSKEMETIVDYFKARNNCMILYLLESHYLLDVGKFLSGCLVSMISMMRFCLPYLNLITKMDLINTEGSKFYDNELELEDFVQPKALLLNYLKEKNEYLIFNEKIVEFLDENHMLDFIFLDWKNEDDIYRIFYSIENIFSNGEDADIKCN